MNDVDRIADWVLRWVLANSGMHLDSGGALRGVVDSLALAELLTAAEFELGRDGWSDLAPADLDTVASLAAHLTSSPPASSKQWYRPLAADPVGPTSASVPPRTGLHATRTSLGGAVVGIEREPSAYAGRTGSVLLVGARARAVAALAAELTAAMEDLQPIPVWYPMLTSAATGGDHPQNVGAGFESGRLPHAACLELLEQLDARPDGLYCGIGFAFRREPARRWNAAGRLEAYRVWEAVWCGAAGDRAEATARLQEAVGTVLARLSSGRWVDARDGFTPGIQRKSEWAADGDGPGAGVALASVNDHGTTFVGGARASFCVGVGLDRIADLELL